MQMTTILRLLFGACSLVIMLFGLVWIWARALVLLFDITSMCRSGR
jgi:hypothetical protein